MVEELRERKMDEQAALGVVPEAIQQVAGLALLLAAPALGFGRNPGDPVA